MEVNIAFQEEGKTIKRKELYKKQTNKQNKNKKRYQKSNRRVLLNIRNILMLRFSGFGISPEYITLPMVCFYEDKFNIYEPRRQTYRFSR